MEQLTSREVDVRVEPPVAGVVIVRVAGEVDLAAAPTLRHCIDGRLGRCIDGRLGRGGDERLGRCADGRCSGVRALVLDLSGVGFFGAAGVSALVHIRSVVERLPLHWAVVAPDVVSRPLRITGLDVGLPMCASLAEALARVAHVARVTSGSAAVP